MLDRTPARLPEIIKRRLAAWRARRARLPWTELEAEAARQGCSPADIFFDLAGRGIRAPDVTYDADPDATPASPEPAVSPPYSWAAPYAQRTTMWEDGMHPVLLKPPAHGRHGEPSR